MLRETCPENLVRAPAQRELAQGIPFENLFSARFLKLRPVVVPSAGGMVEAQNLAVFARNARAERPGEGCAATGKSVVFLRVWILMRFVERSCANGRENSEVLAFCSKATLLYFSRAFWSGKRVLCAPLAPPASEGENNGRKFGALALGIKPPGLESCLAWSSFHLRSTAKVNVRL